MKLRFIALLVFLTVPSLTARAQDQSSATAGGTTQAPTPQALTPTTANGDEYRIGPGDLISIQFYGKGQSSTETRLSRDIHVDGRGMIRMPLIDGDIQAACRTENELADEIGREYRDRQLLRNPIIFVSVKDYQSQPVAVMGEVNAGGRFILRRSVSLVELLNFHAGGVTRKAGKKVQVLSTGTSLTCNGASIQNTAATSAAAKEPREVVTYDLTLLSTGNREVNPYVKPGDIINVPAAEEVLIIGNVVRPSPVVLLEPTTLGRAIAMVGGTLPSTNKDKIKITRSVPGSTNTTEFLVDLKNKDKSQGEGFLLQGGDVVEVPSKTGMSAFFDNFTKSLLPGLTSLPLRVIY
jgi:protein involved in polysaccharide export with SLBB domain